MGHVDHLVDDYLHDLLDSATTRRVAEHCQSCDACREALDRARRRAAAIRDVPATEASADLVAATVDRVEEDAIDRTRAWRGRLWYAVTALAACVLVLVGTQFYYSGLRANPVDLLVLGQSNLLAETNASVRVRLFDRQAKTPLAGVPVTVELVAPGGDARPLAEFQTDASGVGQPAFAVPDVPDGSYRLRVTAQTPTKAEVIDRQVTVKRSWQVMLSTDKPLYQPGQTIHLRALSLRRPNLVPVADQKAVFTLIDPKGNVLFKETTPTSKYGLAAVDCPLAAELPEGGYTLACKIGDSESKQPIPIQKYVLPKLAVDLAFDKPFYAPGDQMVIDVKATYVTGKPVVNGVVALTVAQHGDTVNGKTDAEGKATLRFKALNHLDGHLLGLTCKVTDPAGQANERRAERLVTSKPYRIDLLPENGTLVAGVENTVHVVATRADGTPARLHLSIDGHLEALQTDEQGVTSFKVTPRGGMTLTYRATDDRGRVLDQGVRTFDTGPGGSDFLVRTDRAVYQGGQTMKLAVRGDGSEPVFVDLIREGNERYTLRSETVAVKDGKGELEIDLNPDLVGTLSLLAYRFGPDGLAVQKSRLVQVLPAGALKIEATLDKDEYRPGGEATLKFRLLDGDGKPVVGALSLAGVDEAVYALLPIKPGSEATYFAIEPKVLEPVLSRYQWSPVGRAEPAREQAVFSATARTAVPRREMPTRGEMPARGMPREEELPEPNDGVRPTPSASLGLLSLEATSYRDKVNAVAQIQRTAMAWIYRTWLLLGLVAVGMAYSALWLFMPTREAIALHAGVLLVAVPLGLVVLMVSSDLREATFDAVGMAVAMPGAAAEKSSRMDRESALLDESGSMRARDGSGPRVRNYFPETLLWRPELVTDDAGEATLTLPLADSITTWRINASAVDGQGRLGAREMPLKVFQPFFVDFNLPVSLTRNDQVTIPVVVSSYLDKPQTVTLSLKADDWYDLVAGEKEQKVEIRPGEVKAVSYRVAVRKAGTRQLEVTTRAGEVADAIRRPIEVVPDGRPIDLTASGSLESPYSANINLPDDAIDGSARLLVKVYPSRFSQVVEGLDSIFRMPYGCFEQTSSTTYPNILALDYLQRTRQDRPEIAAKAKRYIALGYQRLVGFEAPGGGFDWFGRPPGNLTLSAYGLMEFEDMARVYDVDPALIDRTRRFLLGKRGGDGSWTSDRMPLHEDPTGGADLATTAYVAWAVFADGRAVESAATTRDFLLKRRPDEIANPHTLALVANALLAIDPTGSAAVPYLDRLAMMATDGPDGQAFWTMPRESRTTFYGSGTAGDIETTALATIALIQGKKAPEAVRRALAWLVTKKDRQGTWHSTQATVLSLRALLAAAATEAEEPKDRTLLVQLGEHRQEIRVPKEKAEVMQWIDLTPHVKAGKQALEVSEPTKTGAGFQVTYRYHVPGARDDANAPLALAVEYGATEVARGGTIAATARVSNGKDKAAAMLLVEVPVPGGFRVRGEDFAALVERQLIARYQVEADRVLVYLREMPKNARLELPYTLEAAQVVDTQAPGGRVYEYYDPSREAFGTPTRLRVTDR